MPLAPPSESEPRSDAAGHSNQPLILFDGVCNLCNAAVAWVVERDRSRAFRFASLQSQAAARAIEAAGEMSDRALPDSIVLIDSAGVHTRSDAAIRIGRRLGLPWSLAVVGYLLPRGVRDGVYSWMARNRYRWFGRRDSCMVPTPGVRERFLDAEEAR